MTQPAALRIVLGGALPRVPLRHSRSASLEVAASRDQPVRVA